MTSDVNPIDVVIRDMLEITANERSEGKTATAATDARIRCVAGTLEYITRPDHVGKFCRTALSEDAEHNPYYPYMVLLDYSADQYAQGYQEAIADMVEGRDGQRDTPITTNEALSIQNGQFTSVLRRIDPRQIYDAMYIEEIRPDREVTNNFVNDLAANLMKKQYEATRLAVSDACFSGVIVGPSADQADGRICAAAAVAQARLDAEQDLSAADPANQGIVLAGQTPRREVASAMR